VAAIILNNEQDKVFITKRHKDAHKGGLWEFPGGKVEEKESAEKAIARELFEEIDIKIVNCEHFQHLEYDYPDKSLKFDFYVVLEFQNRPFGKEGQIGEWVSIAELINYPFPEANVPILEKVIEIYR
jgi:8-oxo-dGTP diphosphatase